MSQLNAARKRPVPREKTPQARPRAGLGPIVAFVLAALGGGGAWLLGTGAIGCSKAGNESAEPGGESHENSRTTDVLRSGEAVSAGSDAHPTAAGSSPPPPTTAAASAAPLVPADYAGPYLGAMAFQTPVYPEPRFSDDRLGYIRQGGKVPVDPKPLKKPNCKEGWYRLLEGGYVCGKYATLDMENPRVKLGVRQPDTSTTVPYKYAYNRFHGTPLYKALPTRDEMLRYEPYLADKDKKKDEEKKKDEPAPKSSAEPEKGGAKHTPGEPEKGAKHAPDDGNVPSGDEAKAAVAAVEKLDTGAPDPDEAKVPAEPKPWWQTDEKKPVVSLADLEKDADGNLSKRMVKGFFVAVDKTFAWNDRTWYRTTSGLLAPTDRMVINKPPDNKGIEWPEGAKSVFFALSEKAQRYELSKDKKKMVEKGKLARFAAVGLTEQTMELDGTTYRETIDGTWVKGSNGTITAPNARPSDVGEHERWVDVNLDKKTLVLFEGDKPVFAALISPGKHSRNKKKDHATPTGAWRVREKHVAVTMDGDGASGDLPYSIEDVPYVAYFKGSYALHAAFWHNNFGREMSHGCVNLAPNDAKYVFNFLEPALPRGWHAAFASKDHPGSMVVIHD